MILLRDLGYNYALQQSIISAIVICCNMATLYRSANACLIFSQIYNQLYHNEGKYC